MVVVMLRVALALVALALPALAQDRSSEPFGHSRHGAIFDEGPRQAAYPMAGMSSAVHVPIAGLSEEAQTFFNQGMTQLHGFWYFEAERSFRQVAKLHPECGMAFLGMALANVESPQRAAGFAAEAVTRSSGVPRYEQSWIDAFAKFYRIDEPLRKQLLSEDDEVVDKAIADARERNATREKADREKLGKQLVKDLGTLVYEFPNDIEAKAQLAVQIWLASDWGSGVPIVSHTAVDSLLDQVFQAQPTHPAHHYRVHLWDSEAAERALRSAAAIGASAPGIAHQWHMAGHIYAKLHRHREAAWQQEASSRVDHAHMHRDRVMPFLIHNYGHNQEWLARSLSHLGRVDEAIAIARNLAALPRHPKFNRLDKGDEIAGYARQRLLTICEEHMLWDEAVRLDEAGWLDRDGSVEADLSRVALLGCAQIRRGDLAAADAMIAELDSMLTRARAERAKKLDSAEDAALAAKKARKDIDADLERAQREGSDLVGSVLELRRELKAERLIATGKHAEGVAELKEITGVPKILLADAHLSAGDPKAAIELLEKEVEKSPGRLPTFGRLVLAYRQANDPAQLETLRAHETKLAEFTRASGPLAARLGLTAAADSNESFPADFGSRPPLAALGPVNWQPQPAPALVLPSATGTTIDLSGRRGKPTLVVFYLGFGCLHCIEQLQAIAPRAAAFREQGIEILAIGTDSVEDAAESLDALDPAERFPFPLLADPKLEAFRAWRCHDDFESLPLHGTFLVDGEGLVRWQDISYEPFTAIDWLLIESKRLLALPARTQVASASR